MENNKTIISFIGDISLNDNYRKHALEGTDLFSDIKPFLNNSDLVVGNLEAMVDAEIIEYPFPKTRLQTDLIALRYLKDLNVGMVTLANNHVYDNLEKGYLKTLSFLKENKIQYIGTKYKNDNACFHKVVEINQIPIAFLNYVHPSTNHKITHNSGVKISEYDKADIVNEIKLYKKKSEIVILILHWGMEDSFYPEPWQINDARDFTKAGANIIVGHHTHTLQGFEEVNGSLVYYSLGNFCFSPVTVKKKVYELDNKRHTESVILNVNIAADKAISFNIVPVKIVNDFIKLGDARIIAKFHKRSKRIHVFKRFYWLYKFYLLFIHKIYSYLFMNGRNPVKQISLLNLSKLTRFIKQQKSIIYHG